MNLVGLFVRVLGVRIAYRLGRALYMHARGDTANDMTRNGELMIQQRVVSTLSDGEKIVCFDVGANVGDWSAALLSRMNRKEQLSLYMFEPVPATAAVLRNRLGEGEYLHYETLALSSEAGSGVMYISGATAGTNSMHGVGTASASHAISIGKTTVEQFCLASGIDVIHLLKCDAEGHDMEVILGALPLLKSGRIGVFQFEYNHRWIFSGHYLKDVFDAIEGMPYRVGKVCPDHIMLFDRWHAEHERFFEANYVLLNIEAMAWFDVRECRIDESNVVSIVKS